VLLNGLLAAAARKKTSYRAAALAAMQKVLAALPTLTSSAATRGVIDGSAVWGTVSPPLLEALQQQLDALTAPSSTAAEGAAGAGSADPSEEPKPLPLLETCRWVRTACQKCPYHTVELMLLTLHSMVTCIGHPHPLCAEHVYLKVNCFVLFTNHLLVS
jgi:hypothetical protein